MHEYYSNQEELLTHGSFKSLKDLESYDLERQSLFTDKLFLPPRMFRDAKLIEFGPDSGENSLVFARWGASCKLIEPNPKAHSVIKNYFNKYKLSDKLDKLVLSDLLSYSKYLKPSEKFDIIDAEGFIYTIRPESLWIDIFNRILNDNGFVIIYYCEAFGSFMELSLKVIHTRICELTGMGDLEAAQKLYAAKWKSIPHKRSMKSWLMDILKNPYVRLHYFFEPQSLCKKMSEAGFYLYSSWPYYKDGLNVHWYKKKLDSGEQLRLQDDFIARSRISHMFGRKNFIVDLDTTLEKDLFNLLGLIDGLIDNFDKDKAMQCVEYLSILEKFINSNKILVDPKETIDTVQTIQSIQHIFQLLVEGKVNDVIEFCNKDKPFINSWGIPSHFAVFKKNPAVNLG